MSQKPALKQPTKLTRPSGPTPARSSTNVSQVGTKQTSAADTKPGSKGSGLAVGVAEQYASDLLRKASSTTPTAAAAASSNAGAADVFKIGDHVWVGGSKPGVIAFMGETQFAAGEWAGVILDAFHGKNDGSVAGVRYFTCEPLKGVFAKTAKLTRHPVAEDTGTPLSSAASAPAPSEDVEKRQMNVDVVVKAEEAKEAERKSPDVVDSMPTSELSSPVSPGVSEDNDTLGTDEDGTPTHATSDGGGGAGFVPPTHKAPKTAAQSKPVSRLPKSNLGSTTSLNQLSLAGSSLNVSQVDPTGEKHNLKVGDRVIVSGNKKGTLRYIGTTLFAEGEWAGVELDDALGKNDGSVGGKRYFKCVPLFGLFAPVAKVARLQAAASTPRRLSTSTSTSSRVPVSTLAASRERSGSQESISSLSSVTSSASRTRVRLGVTSLANQTSKMRSIGTSHGSDSPLQKALKEKEEHVEQLLMERDLERSEVARTAAHAEEVESKMAALSVQYERLLAESEEGTKKLLATLECLEKEKAELVIQVEDEKRKVEDLQFTIEEASIDKGDLESQTESDARKLKEMSVQLEKQMQRANSLFEELSTLKTQQATETDKVDLLGSANPPSFRGDELTALADDRIKEYVEEVKVLNERLKAKEDKERELETENSRLVEETVKLNSAVTSKGQRVVDLETALSEEKTNLLEVKSQLERQLQDLSSSEAMQKKHEQNIDELMSKLVSSETTANSLYSDITKLNAQVTDLELQLQQSGEKYRHLEQDKSALEHQMSELLNSAGDSSQQFRIMTDQLQEKDQKVSALESELSLSQQKVLQLNEDISMRLKEMEIVKTEILKDKEHMEKLEETLKGKEALEVEKTKQLAELKQQGERERNVLMEDKEKELALQRGRVDKITSELGQVRAELEIAKVDRTKENEKAEDTVKKLTMEVEQFRTTVEESKNTVSSLELEKVRLNEDLAKALVDVEQLTATERDLENAKVTLESKVKEMQGEISSLEKAKNELQASSERKEKDFLESISKLEKDIDGIQLTLNSRTEDMQQRILLLEKEKSELQGTMENQERDLRQAVSQLEIEKNEAVARMESKEKDLNEATSQLEMEKKQLKESLDKHVGEQKETLLKLEKVVQENEVGAVAQKDAGRKIAHLSQQVDALTKDLAINKGEVKEIEEVRKMLEEEKEKEIAQRQKELDQVTAELEQVRAELKTAIGNLESAKTGHRKEVEAAEENLKKLTAELEQLTVTENELKNAVASSDMEKVKLNENLATASADVKRLTAAEHDLENEKVMLKSKVKDLLDSVSSLAKENEDLQVALKNNTEIQERFSKLEKEKIEVQASFESKVRELEENISRLEGERNSLQMMLEDKEGKLAENCNRLEKQTSELQLMLENKEKVVVESIAKLEKEKSELQQTLENKEKELVESISRFDKEISDRQASSENKEKEMQESNAKLVKLKDELQETLKNKEMELIETVARLEKEKNEAQASLESTVRKSEENISRLEKEKTEVEVRLTESSADKEIALANLGAVAEQEAAVNSLKEANTKVTHLSQQVDALMKDLAINKGEVKEIEEVRKMLEEEKEKVIAQKQEELDQVRSEMAQVKGELLRVVTELETTKADSIKEFTNQEENVKKLTAELDQLRASGEESKNVISSLELEKVKLSEDLAKTSADVERLSASERDLKNSKVTLESKYKEMQDSISSFEKEKNEIQVKMDIRQKDLLESISMLEKEKNENHVMLESKVRDLETMINNLKLEKGELQMTSDSGAKALQEGTSRLEEEKMQLKVKLDKFAAEKQEALTALEKLGLEKDRAVDAAKEANENIISLSQQVDAMTGELTADKEMIDRLTDKLKTVEIHSADGSEETEILRKKVAELEKTCETVTLENRSLSFQAEKLLTLQAEKEQLSKEVTLLESQIEKASQGNQRKLNDLEDERDLLLNKMEGYKVDNQQKTSLTERLYKEVAQLTADKNHNHNNVQRLEAEVSSLQKQILQLESVAKVEQNATRPVSVFPSTGISNAPQLQEDVENYQAQIDFLNSVIVDIQKKNVELQAKLDAVLANGFAETESAADVSDLSISTSKVAPRLFCDICDMFDLHDTDDCPKQAMSSPDSPPPSKHHGNRNEERLYCDICEVFGHSTEKCDDEQTF